MVINDPYAEQDTLAPAWEHAIYTSQPSAGLEHSGARAADRMLSSPRSVPLMRLSVEGIRIAGANVMALFETGATGELLLAQSLRDPQAYACESSQLTASAEQLHERLKQHLLQEVQQRSDWKHDLMTKASEFLACGGARIRIE